MRTFVKILFLLLGVSSFWGMDTGQQTFSPIIRSLSVSNPSDFMAPPIIRIGSSDRLNINFDIIGDEHQYLRYRLIHCNSDWQPSRLMESEYLDGFNDVNVDDYAYSSGTYVHYVNYNISLPDPNLPIIHSGNYLLQVYDESDPDNILLQARFSVSEQRAVVNGSYTTRTDKGTNSEYQQLFFDVDISSLGNVNPYQDIIISMTQNNRPETTRRVSNPMRINNGIVVYEHLPELIFDAGNEYRRFETVKIDYPGMHVESVDFRNGIWNAFLQKDSSRKHTNYSYDKTQHGRFKIDEYNSSEPDISADYVLVNFTLDPGEKQNGQIYLDGDFTNHKFDDFNLMKYNWEDGLYHASIPLKQGSYNYQYVVIPENSSKPSSAPIEGNKYETGNEYRVDVFLSTPGSRGDRLIGSFTIQ